LRLVVIASTKTSTTAGQVITTVSFVSLPGVTSVACVQTPTPSATSPSVGGG
jgi:hypothetical protein